MGRVESEREALMAVLSRPAGDDAELSDYLCAHSSLPGPRGNLELAHAWAEVCAESVRPAQRLRALCHRWLALDARAAPVNDPLEFLAFCGALGLGALAAAEPAWRPEALMALRIAASDSRWRLREGVAMGLQRLIAASPQATLEALTSWLASPDPLAWRAVAAAVAEPALLGDPVVAQRALALHRQIMAGLAGYDDRRAEGFRTLRQGLGYSLSVVVAACPQAGWAWLRELAVTADGDVRWIVRENLKKKRLAGPYPGQVAEVVSLLAARG